MEYAVGDAVELEVNGVWHAGYISQRDEPRVVEPALESNNARGDNEQQKEEHFAVTPNSLE